MHTHHTHQAPHQKHATVVPSGSTGSTTRTQTAAASIAKEQAPQRVSAEDIRLCAYRKWESAGKPIGDGVQFWLEAEQEMAQKKQAMA